MSTKDNEVNRNIDTDTAEGHKARVTFGEAEDAGKKMTIKPSDGLDDEAEGHRVPRY